MTAPGEELAEAKRPEIEREMRSYFESQERDGKGIWAPTSSWVISACNPSSLLFRTVAVSLSRIVV
jgi:hypothetical protein